MTLAEYMKVRFAPVDDGADRIYTHVEIELDWRERLLLLFRPLHVDVIIDTAAPVTVTRTASWAEAARWRWPWQRGGGGESPAVLRLATLE